MLPVMGAAALALLLSAAPPPPPTAASASAAAEARRLAASKAWDELYLRFSTAKAADFAEKDRQAIAATLLKASQALAADLALSVACAEKSAELAPSVEAWLAVGDGNLKLKQGAAAATAYEKAVLHDPTNARALMARGDLAMQEGEPGLAVSLYSKVPAKAPEAKSAQAKLAKARVAEQERAKAEAELAQASRPVGLADLAGATRKPAPEDPNAVSYEKVCAVAMGGVCGVAKRCMPSDPDVGVCEEKVAHECGKLPGRTRVTQPQLDACVAGLAQAACERFLGGALKLVELSPACEAVQQAMDRLGDPDGVR